MRFLLKKHSLHPQNLDITLNQGQSSDKYGIGINIKQLTRFVRCLDSAAYQGRYYHYYKGLLFSIVEL